MPQTLISLERFLEILPTVCAKETAAGKGAGWTPENPLWGHCAVASLLIQKLFGGTLERASLAGTPFAAGGSHYRNRLPDGSMIDSTAAQFGHWSMVATIPYEHRDREPVIAGADTRVRYAKLAVAVMKQVYADNPLFADDLYMRCLELAYASPCQKAGFGSLIEHKPSGETLADCNRTIDAVAHLCVPECIRNGIQSRTESMVGACGHAEEWVMKQMHDRGWKAADCHLYVAGTTADGLPWLKTKASHTCLRCSTKMHMEGIGMIFVPVETGEWLSITSYDATHDAALYAMGTKKV
jgi:hypothetical protein